MAAEVISLNFEIEGEQLLLRRFVIMENTYRDWSDTFEEIGNELVKTFEMNFNSQGSTLERPWAPLSPKTIEQKRKLGFPLDPLIRTGDMLQGFRPEHGKVYVAVENIVSYFKYKQRKKPRTKIPRRVMMALTNKMRQTIVKKFQKRIDESLD